MENNVWALSSPIAGRHFGISQTMPCCRRLRSWHGASFPSSVGIIVLLGLLEFSDWQLVQVLVEACHLFSSQGAHRHPQLVPLRGKKLWSFQWAPSDHSRDYVSGTIASFSRCLDLFLLGASVAFSGFMVSSSNSRSMVCREHTRAS